MHGTLPRATSRCMVGSGAPTMPEPEQRREKCLDDACEGPRQPAEEHLNAKRGKQRRRRPLIESSIGVAAACAGGARSERGGACKAQCA